MRGIDMENLIKHNHKDLKEFYEQFDCLIIALTYDEAYKKRKWYINNDGKFLEIYIQYLRDILLNRQFRQIEDDFHKNKFIRMIIESETTKEFRIKDAYEIYAQMNEQQKEDLIINRLKVFESKDKIFTARKYIKWFSYTVYIISLLILSNSIGFLDIAPQFINFWIIVQLISVFTVILLTWYIKKELKKMKSL